MVQSRTGIWILIILQERFIQCVQFVCSGECVGGLHGNRAWGILDGLAFSRSPWRAAERRTSSEMKRAFCLLSDLSEAVHERAHVQWKISDWLYRLSVIPRAEFGAGWLLHRARWRILQAELARTDSYLERETRSALELMFMDLRRLYRGRTRIAVTGSYCTGR